MTATNGWSVVHDAIEIADAEVVNRAFYIRIPERMATIERQDQQGPFV